MSSFLDNTPQQEKKPSNKKKVFLILCIIWSIAIGLTFASLKQSIKVNNLEESINLIESSNKTQRLLLCDSTDKEQ